MNTVKRSLLFFVVVGALLTSACSTELDVIGDHKETMIVYGMLDQGLPKQYIKINKAFLGEGDAYMYAQIKDSVQFSSALSVTITKLKDGTVYVLHPDNSIPKDPGIFYGPDQSNAIYTFMTPMKLNLATPTPNDSITTLTTDSEYELVVTNNETGTTVKARTSLITDIGTFTNPMACAIPGSPSCRFSFVAFGSVPNYPFNVLFNAGDNARLYQVILRLNYVDSLTTGVLDTNSIEYTLPTMRVTNLSSNQAMEQKMKGKDFIQFIGNTLNDYPGLVLRRPLKVDLLLAAGSEDLSIFMDVNKPSTGIIQERPEYSNVVGGLGLFSSRLNRKPDSRLLDGTSWDSLACGQYTKHLKFVNELGAHPCF